MHRRLHAPPAALILLPFAALASGCVQMTRHSNMMIFGTNTVVGIRAGVNATSVPEVAVGYTRQEAVVLPLVANVAESGADHRLLVPCDPRTPISAPSADDGSFLVHPCSLVGINGKSMDSYSVLASFGGNFSTSATTGEGKASGGVAQYFATGVAAQLLAATGGASVVASGDAAKASAERAPAADQTIASLYGGSPAFKVGAGLVKPFDTFVGQLKAKITLTDPAQLANKVKAFEAAAGSLVSIAADCTDATACQNAVRDGYAIGYQRTPDKFEAALTAWTLP